MALYDTQKEVYYDDARKIDPETLPDLDCICGGFPCQSFSIAGKRRGFDDARGTLFFEIARIAAVKKPKYLLLENVPGLLSHDKGWTFEAILDTLDELGYDVAWQVLNSADHYVPQARKRVFIVGFLRERCAGRVLSFTDSNPKTVVRRIPGREGKRVYSTDGVGITLTSSAGGFGGKTGLYIDTNKDFALAIKSLTKSGYQIAYPGDSIDLAYPDMNSRRGRVGHDIAHTVVPSATQGYYEVKCIDMNKDPAITELARCITTRQDSGIGHHKGEKSGVLEITEPIRMFSWLGDVFDWICDGIGWVWDHTLGAVIGGVGSAIWDAMFKWLFETIYTAVAKLFQAINNSAIDVFELSWVQAFVKLFYNFGWMLFACGVVVAVFDCAVAYENGSANIKRTSIDIIKGFMAVSLFAILPQQLYSLCVNLQGSFAVDLIGIFLNNTVKTVSQSAMAVLAELIKEVSLFSLFFMSTLYKLRSMVVDDVRKTNGIISFESAARYQKDTTVKRNVVSL